MNCLHKQVIRVENSYIPDYSESSTTIRSYPQFVPIPQWKCIKCDTTLGYLTDNQEVVVIYKVSKRD
jgi:hypothetical protein